MSSWISKLGQRLWPAKRARPLAEEYERIFKEIDPYDLQRVSSEIEFDEADLLGDLAGERHQTRRIVNFYSEQGFEFAFERYGILDKIRQFGFSDLRFTFDIGDLKRQHITCLGTKDGSEYLLMDLMVGRHERRAPEGLEPDDDLELLSIEWLMLQNPTVSFPVEHPRWPGQDHPGLGVNAEVLHLHIQIARRLQLDGVVNHPSRYHIAYLGRKLLLFLDPQVQGRFDALHEALASLDLSDATWRMERGEVRWADDDSVVEWLPEDYVIPMTERLDTYFRSPSYERPRAESFERARARGFKLLPAEPE